MPRTHFFAEYDDFPERPQEHVQETASKGIFLAAIPDRWIPRDISERDYGVDALIEIVPKTLAGRGWRVSGDIAAIQFKSTRSPIVWTDIEGAEGLRKATLSGVSTSSVRYWLRLPMPVFVCYADLTSKKMYFANIDDQVRKQFNDLNQKSMTFTFYDVLEITADHGITAFERSYHRAVDYGDFGRYASDLVLGYGRYKQFFQNHGWQDEFMAVEDSDVLILIHLWILLKKAAYLCDLPWRLTDLAEWFEKDSINWPEDAPTVEPGMMHEATMASVVKELEPAFDEIVEEVVTRIRDIEADYWKRMEYPLYSLCQDWELWKKNEASM